jgi:hypothetical protein
LRKRFSLLRTVLAIRKSAGLQDCIEQAPIRYRKINLTNAKEREYVVVKYAWMSAVGELALKPMHVIDAG